MSEEKLTRRDAIAALAASGIVAGGVGVLNWARTPDTLTDHDKATMQAVAHAIYPSELEGVDEEWGDTVTPWGKLSALSETVALA